MNRRLPSLNGAGPKSKGGPLPPIRLPQESVRVIDGLESSSDSTSRPSALPSLIAVPQAPPSSDVRPKKRTNEARQDKCPAASGPPPDWSSCSICIRRHQDQQASGSSRPAPPARYTELQEGGAQS